MSIFHHISSYFWVASKWNPQCLQIFTGHGKDSCRRADSLDQSLPVPPAPQASTQHGWNSTFIWLEILQFWWNLQTSVGHHIPGPKKTPASSWILHRLAPRIQRIHHNNQSFNPIFLLKSDSKSCYLSIILSFNSIFNPSSSLNFHWLNMMNSPLFIDEPPSFHWLRTNFIQFSCEKSSSIFQFRPFYA